MSKNKLVSVIIPCFNYGDLLPRAVNSVISQTYKDIEIIIVNDGSTDKTDVVAKGLSTKNDNIRYYYQKNEGIVKTRNKGIRLAKGHYIIQLDADDWIDPDYIEQAVSLAEKNNVDIVYTDAELFGGENRRIKFSEHDIEVLKYQNYIHASSLVKKDIFKNRKYDVSLENLGFEDWDLFLGACLAGKKAKKVSGPLLHYRKHSKSRSRTDLISQKKALEARAYIYKKYLKMYPRELAKPSSVEKIIEKLQSDYRHSTDNVYKSYRELIQQKTSLENKMHIMQQSKFWKAKIYYEKLKSRTGLKR